MDSKEIKDPRAGCQHRRLVAIWTDPCSTSRDAEALAGHRHLIERPVVIAGDRAVVARPPERLLELLG